MIVLDEISMVVKVATASVYHTDDMWSSGIMMTNLVVLQLVKEP